MLYYVLDFWVQPIYLLGLLLLCGWMISAVAYYSEGVLLQKMGRNLSFFPLPVLVTGLLYGGLRFSGMLSYATDGWDQWGIWNYTNQNNGACVLFVCGWLLAGVILAIHKKSSCIQKTKGFFG